jgi:hypothetical protein
VFRENGFALRRRKGKERGLRIDQVTTCRRQRIGSARCAWVRFTSRSASAAPGAPFQLPQEQLELPTGVRVSEVEREESVGIDGDVQAAFHERPDLLRLFLKPLDGEPVAARRFGWGGRNPAVHGGQLSPRRGGQAPQRQGDEKRSSDFCDGRGHSR